MRKATVSVPVTVINASGRRPKTDRVVGEEPLEVRVSGAGEEPSTIAVTMRTPGHDFELAVGFLRTEGIIQRPTDVRRVEYCTRGVGVEQQYNIVTVAIGRAVPPESLRRMLVTTASCGICGSVALDAVERDIPQRDGEEPEIDAEVLLSLPDRLRAEQSLFDRTGGLHAAGLFGVDGQLLVLREDVGRHNAVDKTIGWATLNAEAARRLGSAVLFVSGRTSFEIVQKAAMAGIRIVAAVSAPSSLAIDAANRFGVTLAGFVRDGSANLYTHPHRVA